jgi:hypothetical protein
MQQHIYVAEKLRELHEASLARWRARRHGRRIQRPSLLRAALERLRLITAWIQTTFITRREADCHD